MGTVPDQLSTKYSNQVFSDNYKNSVSQIVTKKKNIAKKRNRYENILHYINIIETFIC